MVMTKGVAVSTTIVDHPRHALAWMLVDEEHRIESNAHHTPRFLRALRNMQLGRWSR